MPAMAEIDPAALTRMESFSQPLPPTAFSSRPSVASALTLQKPAKASSANIPQRIDLEPFYTALKNSIGLYWAEYKEAVGHFVLGHLNQNEFCLRTDHFLTTNPLAENMHNQLIAGILANVPRELPDAGVAPFVSTNDKPMVLSKPASGDAAELRLKMEVKQLPTRDRRRIKDVPEPDTVDPIAASVLQYHQAKQFRSAEAQSAGGSFSKTNLDLEIRKRYAQPLASETGEFPDAETIQARIRPICYEESVSTGSAPGCAPFMATATEHFIKEVLSNLYTRTRLNMPGGSVKSAMTYRFKKQLAREEDAALKDELDRVPGTRMLPVELREAQGRKPLSMGDLRLALGVGDCGLGPFPLVGARVMEGYQDGEFEATMARRREIERERHEAEDSERQRVGKLKAVAAGPLRIAGINGLNGVSLDTNGVSPYEAEDDDEDWGWEGGGYTDRGLLGSVLDDCLAVGQ